MINPDLEAFPNNIITAIYPRVAALDADLTVLRRPLRAIDPGHSIGLFGALWMPDEESFEIGHNSPGEPTLQRYQLGIQALVKDGDEERGLKAHAVLSMLLRRVLYRDQLLRVSLGSLFVTDGSSTERARRWGVTNQRYMNNEVEGTFIYLSTLEYWLETETA